MVVPCICTASSDVCAVECGPDKINRCAARSGRWEGPPEAERYGGMSWASHSAPGNCSPVEKVCRAFSHSFGCDSIAKKNYCICLGERETAWRHTAYVV